MPDPNARRDKALEAISKELGQMNDLLQKIERNTRSKVQITNNPYFERSERPDELEKDTLLGPNPYDPYAANPDTGPYGSPDR